MVGRSACCRGRGRCGGRRRPRRGRRGARSSPRRGTPSPMTCTGRPSAEASSSLSAVMSAQEKSRAMLSTAERPERSSVFVISRHDARRGGWRSRRAGPGRAVRASHRVMRSSARAASARTLEQVVAELRHASTSIPGRRRRSSSAPRRSPARRSACPARQVAPSRNAAVSTRLRQRRTRPAASRARAGRRRCGGAAAQLRLVERAPSRGPSSTGTRRAGPARLTAKTRSCASWNASTERVDVGVAVEPAAGSGTSSSHTWYG